MDISLDVAKGISQVKERFKSEAAQRRAVPLLRKAMKRWLDMIAGQASQNAVTMFSSHPSGQLAKSIIAALKRGDGIAGEIYSKLIYAGIQEEGTDKPIKPVHGQWLTQPLPGARAGNKASGRIKMSARKFFEKYKNKPGTSVFIGKSKKGNMLIFLSEYKGKGRSKLTPLFLLRKQTTIQGKYYIKKAIESSPGFDEYLGDDFIRALTS